MRKLPAIVAYGLTSLRNSNVACEKVVYQFLCSSNIQDFFDITVVIIASFISRKAYRVNKILCCITLDQISTGKNTTNNIKSHDAIRDTSISAVILASSDIAQSSQVLQISLNLLTSADIAQNCQIHQISLIVANFMISIFTHVQNCTCIVYVVRLILFLRIHWMNIRS